VVIKCSSKDQRYYLGTGWHPTKMVIDDAEAGMMEGMSVDAARQAPGDTPDGRFGEAGDDGTGKGAKEDD